MKLQSINPANYKIIGEIDVSTEREIISAVESANRAKQVWRQTPLKVRIQLLKQTEEIFKKRAHEIAETITKEVGTPITECIGEISWDWSYWDWFCDNARNALMPETTNETETALHQIWYEPIGTAAVITPWNLPFDMFIWGVIPNLLAGNTVVYKASEICPLTGKLFADIMAESPLPPGVFQAIHGDGVQGEQLTQQPIDLIWFTGSSEIGEKLYELSGKKFIKSTLEMGGSNPVIVFADADLDKASNGIMSKRFMFSGQTCDADKRLLVEETVADKLIAKLTSKIESIKVGDPNNSEIQMGPLSSKNQLEMLKSQVNEALKNGAKILTQTVIDPSLVGAYYPPTLLGDVNPEMRVWKDEVFGPVLPYITFNTEAEAIELANNTQYGLGSQIYSCDSQKALRVAAAIEAGNVDINSTGHFSAFNPFGGYKRSGMGREHGIHGLRELCQIKVVSRNK